MAKGQELAASRTIPKMAPIAITTPTAPDHEYEVPSAYKEGHAKLPIMKLFSIAASPRDVTTQTLVRGGKTARTIRGINATRKRAPAEDFPNGRTLIRLNRHKEKRWRSTNDKDSQQYLKRKGSLTISEIPPKRQATTKAVIQKQASPPYSPFIPQLLRRSNRQPCPRKLSPNEYTSDESSEDRSQTTITDEETFETPSPLPKPPPSSFTQAQYDHIHQQVHYVYKRSNRHNMQDRYKIMMELADIALRLDIAEMDHNSADVPGIIVYYFERICQALTEEEEVYVMAQTSSAKNGPNLLERLRLLTGLHEVESTPIDVAISQQKSPWTKLYAVQKHFDDGQQFFDFENYIPQIQASLDRLAMTRDVEFQYDHLGDVVDIIDTMSNQCKRRVLFDSRQAAFETYMYIIKATERCIRYKGERWDFSTVVDVTQLAILRLLDPNSMEDADRSKWLENPSLNRWLYLMSKQQGWHLPNMTRVVNQFHGMENVFARQLGVDSHRLPEQEKIW